MNHNKTIEMWWFETFRLFLFHSWYFNFSLVYGLDTPEQFLTRFRMPKITISQLLLFFICIYLCNIALIVYSLKSFTLYLINSIKKLTFNQNKNTLLTETLQRKGQNVTTTKITINVENGLLLKICMQFSNNWENIIFWFVYLDNVTFVSTC